MKTISKIILLASLLVLDISLVQAQSVYIYDESGNKLYFQKIENEKFVTISSAVNQTKRELIKQKLNTFGGNFQEKSPFVYKVTLNSQQKTSLFSQLNQDTVNLKISPMFMYSDSTIQWTSNEIIIKTFPNSNLTTILNNHSILYSNIRQLGYDLQVFVVTLSGVEDKTFEYSNLLYESGNVVFAQPAFWKRIKKQSSFFADQWGLNNTGQYGGTVGIDINAPEAWQIASGTNIKVAIIDEGVDLNHIDLSSNLLQGYDATDGELGGSNGNCKGNDAHGTNCAGIVAALNNGVGITGVAYNSKIIPVRIAYQDPYGFGFWITNDVWIADGIYNAWYVKDADVLSNSWGGGSNSAAINNEINNALTLGRNGKGTIIVFASGNNNGNISYPATFNPNILVVGAISPCGERKSPSSCDGEGWGSNYGGVLDVVAPGVLISSTDITGNAGYNPNVPIHTGNGGNKITSDYTNQDYTVWFNGTSAACPHVAGVAALVLSVNPNLTGLQVRNIIEQTAQKVRKDLYTYSVSSWSSSTWNNQMGYGLVDAYAAVLAARATLPFDLMVRDSISDNGPVPNNVAECWNSPDIWVRNNNDNGTTQQNPEYHPSQPNWVYVRVKNVGGYYTGSTNLMLHWAKASASLSWNDWNGNTSLGSSVPLGGVVGTLAIPALQANQDTIIKFPWLVPNPADYQSINPEPWHFCLLARIVSDIDTMTYQETLHYGNYVLNNNNVAMKNLTVVDVVANNITSTLAVGNIYAMSRSYDLIFRSPANETGSKAHEDAEISITLDNALASKWQQTNRQGTNVERKRDGKILVKGANAVLNNLNFAPNEINTINLTFNFLTKQVSNKESYGYSVILQDNTTGDIIGGESYLIKRDYRQAFRANAGSNLEVEKNETFTLNAELISEDAIYNWYDGNDSLIYEGADFTTSTQIGQHYLLEVIALADGYKDYAEVSVTLKPNSIKNIYPNPASNVADVEYRITDASTAYLSIVNYYNPQISNNYILNLSSDTRSLDLQTFPTGIYVVTLICDGQISDSKILVKQ